MVIIAAVHAYLNQDRKFTSYKGRVVHLAPERVDETLVENKQCFKDVSHLG